MNVHAINLDHVIPFYNPSNIPFSYNQSTRKSFNRGSTPKMKLSLKSGLNNNDHRSGSLTSGKEVSSPSSLSFEMIDESIEEPQLPQTSTRANAFEQLATKRESVLYSLPSDNYVDVMNVDVQSQITPDDGLYFDNYSNDLDYYPERIMEPEREDFPVNNAQQPDYAPKLDNGSLSSGHKTGKTKHLPAPRKASSNQSKSSLAQAKRLSNSTVDLHSNLYDTNGTTFGLAKKNLSSRGGSPTRNYTAFNHNNNSKLKRNETPKETNHARNNRKITVQIMAKPPPRSKTSLDLRASSAMSQHSLPSAASTFVHSPILPSQPKAFNNPSFNGSGSGSAEENAEISVLTAYHERVYQQLSTRYATLQLVRNSTRYD